MENVRLNLLTAAPCEEQRHTAHVQADTGERPERTMESVMTCAQKRHIRKNPNFPGKRKVRIGEKKPDAREINLKRIFVTWL